MLILTLNEEINIAGCMQSVAWCDDIVVLDSGSTDETVPIAEALGARIVRRRFDNWAQHQNWALQNIRFRHPWVFNLDADERIDDELAAELASSAREPGGHAAFKMRRKDFFRNTWLKHAGFYPSWFTRFYRPEKVRFERLVNPVTIVDGSTGALNGHILHWPFSKGMTHWLERHNSYSSFEAIEYARKPPFRIPELFSSDATVRRRAAKAMFARAPGRPLIKFLFLYVAHRGFLDGRAGLDFAVLQFINEYMVSLKIRETKTTGDRPEAVSRPLERKTTA